MTGWLCCCCLLCVTTVASGICMVMNDQLLREWQLAKGTRSVRLIDVNSKGSFTTPPPPPQIKQAAAAISDILV
jgi:hypothetical protein